MWKSAEGCASPISFRLYYWLNVILSDGHFRTLLLLLRVPLTRNSGTGLTVPDTEVNCLTIPDPNCCSKPDPDPSGPDDKTVEVRRDRIDCMLDDNKNGTLLEVLGMEPPCFWEYNKGDFFGRLVKAYHHGRFIICELCGVHIHIYVYIYIS